MVAPLLQKDVTIQIWPYTSIRNLQFFLWGTNWFKSKPVPSLLRSVIVESFFEYSEGPQFAPAAHRLSVAKMSSLVGSSLFCLLLRTVKQKRSRTKNRLILKKILLFWYRFLLKIKLPWMNISSHVDQEPVFSQNEGNLYLKLTLLRVLSSSHTTFFLERPPKVRVYHTPRYMVAKMVTCALKRQLDTTN